MLRQRLAKVRGKVQFGARITQSPFGDSFRSSLLFGLGNNKRTIKSRIKSPNFANFYHTSHVWCCCWSIPALSQTVAYFEINTNKLAVQSSLNKGSLEIKNRK